MEENTGQVELDDSVVTSAPFSVGKALREARIQQGLSVADVAASIKFAPRQVEALEADDFNHLPELAFLRGFVRSYSRLLHIEEAPLLAALQPTSSSLPKTQVNLDEIPFPSAQSSRRINVVWLSAAFALALLLAVGIWLFHDSATPPKLEKVVAVQPVPVVPVLVSSAVGMDLTGASVVPQTVVQSTPLPGQEVVKKTGNAAPIHLVFAGQSWVDIKDKSGKTLLKQVNEPQTEQWVTGRPPFSLVIGNSSEVRLYYEGEEVDLDSFTDVEVARLTLE